MKKQQLDSLEARIMICKEYAALWQRFFSYFSESLADKQITQQMESEFEQVLGILAINQYKFEELVGDHMPDARKILNVLSDAVSLGSIKSMQEVHLSKLQLEWHELFISMNKALGKLSNQLTPKMIAAMQARDGAGE
jgi:hypothetical protein